MSNRLYNQFSYSPERQPVSLMGKFTKVSLNTAATLVNQGITYTAKTNGANGASGNSITITIINPIGDGALSIATVGTAITITLGKTSGVVVTDANALVAAITGDAPASVLITAAGTGSTPLVGLTITNLSGGANPVISTNALRMSMTEDLPGRYIIQLEDEYPEVLSCQVELLSASVINLVPQVISTATAFDTAKKITIRTVTMASSPTLTTLPVNAALFVHLILRNSSNP